MCVCSVYIYIYICCQRWSCTKGHAGIPSHHLPETQVIFPCFPTPLQQNKPGSEHHSKGPPPACIFHSKHRMMYGCNKLNKLNESPTDPTFWTNQLIQRLGFSIFLWQASLDQKWAHAKVQDLPRKFQRLLGKKFVWVPFSRDILDKFQCFVGFVGSIFIFSWGKENTDSSLFGSLMVCWIEGEHMEAHHVLSPAFLFVGQGPKHGRACRAVLAKHLQRCTDT